VKKPPNRKRVWEESEKKAKAMGRASGQVKHTQGQGKEAVGGGWTVMVVMVVNGRTTLQSREEKG